MTERFDVCVIGGGPAGMITCLELAAKRPDLKIGLLEYGPVAPGKNSLDESIRVLNLVNHHPPDECTNKGLGGSSATWGGRCVSYDEIDFLPRAAIGDSCTWDLALFEEVQGFYDTAAQYMECGEPLFKFSACFPQASSSIAEGFYGSEIIDDVLERWSMPTRFGTRYRENLERCKNVSLIERTEVTDLSPLPDGDILVKAILNPTSAKTTFQCKKLVIAAGAQETTRLLFRSPSLFPDGIVPHSLGKYYQGHISGKIASVVFTGDPGKTDFGFQVDRGVFVRRRLQFSTETLLRENLLNTAIWLDNPLYSDPSHRNGTMSFIYLMMVLPVIGKKLAPPAIANSITKGTSRNIGAHLGNILRDLPGSLLEPASIFWRRYFLPRKLPGVFLYSPTNRYALHFHAEQVPLEENQMCLSEDGKTLNIQYGYCDADIDSVLKTHQLLDTRLQELGIGKLEYWYSPEEVREKICTQSKDGIHQVGTTRISLKPEDGVINRDLALWARSNVFVCSSSAFPTSGQANPTFLLAAFAARLAAHLEEICER